MSHSFLGTPTVPENPSGQVSQTGKGRLETSLWIVLVWAIPKGRPCARQSGVPKKPSKAGSASSANSRLQEICILVLQNTIRARTLNPKRVSFQTQCNPCNQAYTCKNNNLLGTIDTGPTSAEKLIARKNHTNTH
jgi:hypothetical protein